MPHEFVSPHDLKDVVENGGNVSELKCILIWITLDTRKVYGTEVVREDHLYRKDDGTYSTTDYEANPEQYESCFADKVKDIC